MPRRARVLAMIMAGGKGERLHPLTRERSKSAVPFGGRFRLIDFVLSNFMNSELPSIYVLVQYKSQSLIEHLRIAWRTSGLLPDFFVTVVPPQMRFGPAWYRGTADAVLQNLNLIDDFNADVIAIFGSDHIYRMDVTQMLAFHQGAGADVTIAARPVPIKDASAFGVLGVDRKGSVVQLAEKPATPTPMPDDPHRALADRPRATRTEQPPRPPARFIGADVDNAQIGEGSLVKRATIRNSILGRSVWVNEGAVIEDSIVMDHTTVGKGARLRRAIIDRFNIISADTEIGIDPARDRRRFHVDPSGLVVVPRGGRREFLGGLQGFWPPRSSS